MADYIIYDATVSVLAPLHIGNGRELLHQYDYVIRSKRTWRIDEQALLDAVATDDPHLGAQLMRSRPAELLRDNDFREDGHAFRYVLNGTPRSAAEGAVLREQIKDPFDRLYLPGSSLKGALRTAVAWHALEATETRLDARSIGRRKQWAAQEVERRLLGGTPNQDLLRALHVADSAPVDADRLLIANVRVHHRSGKLASPIELEAVRGDTVFRTTIKLDQALFSQWARRYDFQLAGQEWLQTLPAIAQARAAERIRRERDWFAAIGNAQRVHGFYAQLAGVQLDPTRFFIQLGWGTGWDDKTFGSRLQQNAPLMERLIDDFRLARGRRQSGDPFPRSRRLVVSFRKTRDGRIDEVPVAPLGWCLVELKARDS